MSLLHQKARECGIKPSCREENEALFRAIVAGEPVTDRLIEGNMAYVVMKVQSFIRQNPQYAYLRDDLISEGLLTLTCVAEHLTTLGEIVEDSFYPQALLFVALRNSILKLVRKEPANISLDGEPLAPPDVRALLQRILDCCEDETDRVIVRRRLRGERNQQIATALGISRQAVEKRRSGIFRRFSQTQPG